MHDVSFSRQVNSRAMHLSTCTPGTYFELIPFLIDQWMPIGVWYIIGDSNLRSTIMWPIISHGWYDPVGSQTMAVVPECICYSMWWYSIFHVVSSTSSFKEWRLNSTRPNNTYVRQLTGPSFVKIRACCLIVVIIQTAAGSFHYTLEINFHRTSYQLFTNIIIWIGCHFC